jgi:broad specificity phosphatase PhoE
MILVRHGQSEFNVVYGVTRRDPGIIDPKLTAEGEAQARRAARILKEHGIERLIASPYTRALQTAEIIAASLGLAIQIEPVVRERGAFVCDIGSPASQLRRSWPGLDFGGLPEIWWPEQEEPEAMVAERCAAFRIAAAAMADRDRVAVVSHWGFIRGLTEMSVTNGTVLRIDPDTAPCPARELTLSA